MPAKGKVGTLVTEGNLSPEKRFHTCCQLVRPPCRGDWGRDNDGSVVDGPQPIDRYRLATDRFCSV